VHRNKKTGVLPTPARGKIFGWIITD
jgi:hypothetical protein